MHKKEIFFIIIHISHKLLTSIFWQFSLFQLFIIWNMLNIFFLDCTSPVLSTGIHICYSIYIMCRLSWIIKISWSSREVTYMSINNSYFSLQVTSIEKPEYWKIIWKRTGKERPEGRQNDRKNIWHQVQQGKKMVINREEGFPWSTHTGMCSPVLYPARGAPKHDLIWSTGHLCWSAKES